MKGCWFILVCFFSTLCGHENEIHLPAGPLKYAVDAGSVPIHLQDEKIKGSIFYVYYSIPSDVPRPVTFCFNGGPGSASVWIHMAGVGPKIIETTPLEDYKLPVKITDNPHTLLPYTDLVFVDAMYTGFSRPEIPTQASEFFSYTNDVYSLSYFMDEFIRKHHLEKSPLYLLGCSYSTLRVIGLANELKNTYKRPVDGLIMLSTLLNFQSLSPSYQQNDTPYPLLIPSFAVAAWVHGLGSSRKYDKEEWIKQSSTWAIESYLPALMKGDSLTQKEKSKIAEEMAGFIGIEKELIEIRNLRLDPNYYIKELLRKDNRIIGRFDLRYTGIDNDINRTSGVEADPSYIIMGTIAAGFQDYLKNELHVEIPTTPEYFYLGKVENWRYVKNSLHFLCLNKTLSNLLQELPKMKIFVGSGIYDLATPYRVAQNDFSHLNIDPADLHQRVSMKLYEGGHMFYTDKNIQGELVQDIKNRLF